MSLKKNKNETKRQNIALLGLRSKLGLMRFRQKQLHTCVNKVARASSWVYRRRTIKFLRLFSADTRCSNLKTRRFSFDKLDLKWTSILCQIFLEPHQNMMWKCI